MAPRNALTSQTDGLFQLSGPSLDKVVFDDSLFRRFVERKLNNLALRSLNIMRRERFSPFLTGCMVEAIGWKRLRIRPGGRSTGGTYSIDLSKVPYARVQELKHKQKRLFMARGARLTSSLWAVELAKGDYIGSLSFFGRPPKPETPSTVRAKPDYSLCDDRKEKKRASLKSRATKKRRVEKVRRTNERRRKSKIRKTSRGNKLSVRKSDLAGFKRRNG